ncbi:MAG: hypothetical protein Q9204_000954 [Flavoplaca sp. TL-2023a]
MAEESFSLDELDIALSRLTDREGSSDGSSKITDQTLKSLAALAQLADTSQLPVQALMPFFGLMDTYGDTPLYSILFLQGRAINPHPVFGKTPKGRYLNDDSRKLSANRDILAFAFNIDEQ